MLYDQAHALAGAIRESDEYKDFTRLRDVANADETNRTLLKEYKRLQMKLQMAAVSHADMPQEEMQRFQQLGTLLYMNADVQAYLLAEMRMQKVMADIFKILSDAGGINLDFLGG